MPAHSPIPTTVDEAIEGYLIHITRHFSPQTCSAYSQALNLFTKVLHSDLHVRTSQVSIDELQTGWGEHFLNYLQSTRSVETEHLYSRAMIDFFHHAEIHHWTKTTSSDLAAYVLQHRRPKQHNIPTPPQTRSPIFLPSLQQAPSHHPQQEQVAVSIYVYTATRLSSSLWERPASRYPRSAASGVGTTTPLLIPSSQTKVQLFH